MTCLWFIDGSSRNEGGAFGDLSTLASPAPAPAISGAAYQGQTLTSTLAGQWFLNGAPIDGATGDTLVVPETVLPGDAISQQGSNVLVVVLHPDAWVITVDTTRTTEKTTPDNTFWLMGRNGVNDNIKVYWGDRTVNEANTWNHANRTHQYAEGGVYQIQALGLTTVDFNYRDQPVSDFPKINNIDQWGADIWAGNQSLAFLAETSPHVPDGLPSDMRLTSVTDVSGMLHSLGKSGAWLPAGLVLNEGVVDAGYAFYGNNTTVIPDGVSLNFAVSLNAAFQGSVGLTDLPSGMKLSAMASGTSMFANSTINTPRYSQLLIDMEATNPNSNVPFHGGSSKYNEAAAPSRYNLYMRGWTITDGGPDFAKPLIYGLPHAEGALWSTHTGQWALDGTPISGETGQTLVIPSDAVDGQEITQLGSDPVIVANTLDADAVDYIRRVETADSYPLETSVKLAIDDLFVSLKAAPAPIAATNFEAIAAGTALLMAGPRTLAGALVPLVDTMPTPTNYNFVGGDYNRKTGLKGNGANKYLSLDLGTGDFLVTDAHMSCFVTEDNSAGLYAGVGFDLSNSGIFATSSDSYEKIAGEGDRPRIDLSALWGASAYNGTTTRRRSGSSNTTPSGSRVGTGNIYGFSLYAGDYPTAMRLSSITVGQAADLESLDTALTAYMAALEDAL